MQISNPKIESMYTTTSRVISITIKNYYYTTRVFVGLFIVYKLVTNLLKALRTCNFFSVCKGRELKISY